MLVERNISVPTGNILIVQGEKGLLECLSIGDYGKEVNLNQHRPVTHCQMLPLEEKWVATLSTQYGCSMGCTFCDVPNVGPGINATYDDLKGQLKAILELHPEVTHTNRLNIHYARMGEPTWNRNVLYLTRDLREVLMPHLGDSLVHPVVSTMMPKRNSYLEEFLEEWMDIKNHLFKGDAGLQLSINSTDDLERDTMFSGNALSLTDIAHMVSNLAEPSGRKITLNFAVAQYTIDAQKLRDLFDPRKVVIKLTPMHKTTSAACNGIETKGDYTQHFPYLHHEEALKAVGFDVLTFIASYEEDMGRITCGNAILSGTMPFDR